MVANNQHLDCEVLMKTDSEHFHREHNYEKSIHEAAEWADRIPNRGE